MASFLEIQMARLTVAHMLGVIDRWIKRRINEASEIELLSLEEDLWTLARRSSKEEDRITTSMGRLRNELHSHRLYGLVFKERIKREVRKESSDPQTYFGPLYNLTESEINEYLIWKGEKHGTVPEWIKDRRRNLPIIVNERKDLKENNRHLSGSREESQSFRSNGEGSLKGSKAKAQGTKAYGPRKTKG